MSASTGISFVSQVVLDKIDKKASRDGPEAKLVIEIYFALQQSSEHLQSASFWYKLLRTVSTMHSPDDDSLSYGFLRRWDDLIAYVPAIRYVQIEPISSVIRDEHNYYQVTFTGPSNTFQVSQDQSVWTMTINYSSAQYSMEKVEELATAWKQLLDRWLWNAPDASGIVTFRMMVLRRVCPASIKNHNAIVWNAGTPEIMLRIGFHSNNVLMAQEEFGNFKVAFDPKHAISTIAHRDQLKGYGSHQSESLDIEAAQQFLHGKKRTAVHAILAFACRFDFVDLPAHEVQQRWQLFRHAFLEDNARQDAPEQHLSFRLRGKPIFLGALLFRVEVFGDHIEIMPSAEVTQFLRRNHKNLPVLILNVAYKNHMEKAIERLETSYIGTMDIEHAWWKCANFLTIKNEAILEGEDPEVFVQDFTDSLHGADIDDFSVMDSDEEDYYGASEEEEEEEQSEDNEGEKDENGNEDEKGTESPDLDKANPLVDQEDNPTKDIHKDKQDRMNDETQGEQTVSSRKRQRRATEPDPVDDLADLSLEEAKDFIKQHITSLKSPGIALEMLRMLAGENDQLKADIQEYVRVKRLSMEES